MIPRSRARRTFAPAHRVLLAAMACVCVAALSGCGSSASPSSAPPSKLSIWYSTDDSAEARWAAELVTLFNRSHPRIHASISVYGFEDFNPKLLIALGAGNPPDLAYATPRTCGIPKYVQNGKLVNLSSDASRLHWAALLRPGLLQDYNSPFAIFASKRYGVAPSNVQVYAVPSAMAAVGVMYNSALLRRLGLTIPRSVPQLEADVSMARRHGFIPLGLGNADGFLGDDWYQTLVNTRLPYADLERELLISPRFTFERPPFRWAAAQMIAWRPDFTPNSGGLDAQEGVNQFFQGKTLFQLISSSENPQIKYLLGKYPGTHVGVFGFPGWTTASRTVMPQSGYEGWIVPTQGHNPSGAVTFINWMLQPSTQRFLMRQGVLPATSPTAAQEQGASEFLRQYLDILRSSRPGVFLDAAPILNLNATMEANVQFLLNMGQSLEPPTFLPHALQLLYSHHGATNKTPAQIDCEF